MTEQYAEENLNATIDRLLAERRPDRYEKSVGDDWLDDVADEIAPGIPSERAIVLHARSMVRNREGTKTQSTNRLLRQIWETGQLPLDGWLDQLNLPLAVGKERVALRAAGPDDFERHAIDERRDAARDFAARNAAAEGSEWIAGQMRANGWTFGADIAPDELGPA